MKRETARLWLEPFAPVHLDGLSVLDSDPDIMRFLGGPKTRAQTQDRIAAVAARWATLGYGWWALIAKADGALIGAACLQNVENNPDHPLEIGWRLAPVAQGKGYATEAGQAAMDYAFEVIKAKQVIAIADPDNAASIKVMQRLRMTYHGIARYYDTNCATYVKERS